MKNIAITGYFGTGSSAVLDLLKEYDGISRVPLDRKSYEHVPFYISGGLFDLCAILTKGNVPLRSDKAINNFIDSMSKINKYDFTWFGAYEKQFDGKFWNIVEEFVSSISTRSDGVNLNHCIHPKISLYYTMRSIVARYLFGKERILPYYINLYDKRQVYFAMPTDDELYKAAKCFTSSYLNLFTVKKGSDFRIFDHLIWPQQIDAYLDCFDSTLKFIVVERDPRDLYLLTKYIYTSKGTKPFFPTNPVDFVNIWNRFIVKTFNNPNVLRVQFEDLVYDYDNSIKTIESFVDISPIKHEHKKIFLNPQESIENTQVFRVKEEWKSEIEYIEKELPTFLYNFPYEREPNYKLMFNR